MDEWKQAVEDEEYKQQTVVDGSRVTRWMWLIPVFFFAFALSLFARVVSGLNVRLILQNL